MTMLLLGHFLLGLIAGGLTGMSQTPVVGTVLPAVIAFGGGSVLGLSVAEGTSAEDLRLLGEQMTAFAGGMILGLAAGIALFNSGTKLPFRRS
jgi:hypothetical protein